ncbi:MAG: dicarboxylate/amino acid:cation symporter [Eubacterium sp.]|nr:dicarboxylate/amino acid:cation symporter [Eubacterium sp.]
MLLSEEYELNNENIDVMSEKIQAFMKEKGYRRMEVAHFRLVMEELLLRIAESEESPETVTLVLGKKQGRNVISIRYAGRALDVTRGDEDEWNDKLLESLGQDPTWGYGRGVNHVTVKLPKVDGGNTLISMILAIVAAVVIGGSAEAVAPEFMLAVNDTFIEPAAGAFLAIITTMGSLVVLTSIMNGIFGVGDVSTLGRFGKVMFPRFFAVTFITGIAALLMALPFVNPVWDAPEAGESQAKAMVELVLGVVPTDIVSPFQDGNTLQIIFIAIVLAITLLVMGERVRHVVVLVEELYDVTQYIMEQVCRLLPVYIFVSILNMVWSGRGSALVGLWKPIVIVIALDLIIITVYVLVVCLQTGTSPILFIAKILPVGLIGFSTASSMAAFNEGVEMERKSLGIGKSVTTLGLPVGSVIFMPAVVVCFVVVPLYLAEYYQVPVSMGWFFTLVFVAGMLAVAVPPVPGAGVTCYVIILTQMGIPVEAVSIAIALDVILDHVDTGFNILHIHTMLTSVASSMGELDKETLHSKSAG